MQKTSLNCRTFFAKGSFINDVTVLGEGRRQGLCDDIFKTLVTKCVMVGWGGVRGVKIFQNCVTSFRDEL